MCACPHYARMCMHAHVLCLRILLCVCVRVHACQPIHHMCMCALYMFLRFCLHVCLIVQPLHACMRKHASVICLHVCLIVYLMHAFMRMHANVHVTQIHVNVYLCTLSCKLQSIHTTYMWNIFIAITLHIIATYCKNNGATLAQVARNYPCAVHNAQWHHHV